MKKPSRVAICGVSALLLGLHCSLPSGHFTAQQDNRTSTPAQVIATTVPGATQPLFDSQPGHIWNRLHSHLFVRRARNGKEYGFDEVDPLYWRETKYLLEGQSHQQAIALLNEFLSTHAGKSITDPLKRAMFQHDLWTIFDWASATDKTYQTERRELRNRLAQIIKGLALTSNEINALPDNYAAAIAAKSFSERYRPEDPDAAFLPPDMFQADGEWVCLGNVRTGPVAQTHVQFFDGRSTFLAFLRLPQGRAATVAYLKTLREFPQPWVVNPKPGPDEDPVLPNPDTPQLPVGTQVALVRQLVLIDSEGRLTATNVTESMELRIYAAVPPGIAINPDQARQTQHVSKFVLSRAKLFAGADGGLRAMGRDEKEFPIFMSHGVDWFEIQGAGPTERFQQQALKACGNCHSAPGIHSLLSYSRRRLSSNEINPPRIVETTPRNEASNTLYWKARQFDWGLLRGLWP